MRLALLLVLAAGCRAPLWKPQEGLDYELRSPLGTFRAASAEACVDAAQLAERAWPFLEDLPALERRALVLHLVPERPLPFAVGITSPRLIEVWQGSEYLASVIAHEMVHFYLGREWRELPQVVEEGLADFVAEQVDPLAALDERAYGAVALASALFDPADGAPGPVHLVASRTVEGTRVVLSYSGPVHVAPFPSVREALDLDPRALLEVEHEPTRSALYALGYAFARRIGPAGLYELCLRARREGRRTIPASWLFEGSGLSPDLADWWPERVGELLGDAQREVLQRRLEETAHHVPAALLDEAFLR